MSCSFDIGSSACGTFGNHVLVVVVDSSFLSRGEIFESSRH